MANLKPIPQFKNEDQEREFWPTRNSAEYIDWGQAERAIFPNLKPSTKTISIRLPEHLLNRIRSAASRQDVPYQSYIKTVLDRAVK